MNDKNDGESMNGSGERNIDRAANRERVPAFFYGFVFGSGCVIVFWLVVIGVLACLKYL